MFFQTLENIPGYSPTNFNFENFPDFSEDSIKVTLVQEEFQKQLNITYSVYMDTPEYKANQFKSQTCNICLDDFESEDTIMVLNKCSHYYHQDCISTWLTNESNKCPICKVEVGKGRANIPDNHGTDFDSEDDEMPPLIHDTSD